MKYNIHSPPPRVGQSLSFSPCRWWPAGWGAASSNGEACGQASSGSARLLKCIPLCILQYPPFFSAPFKTTSLSPSWLFKIRPPSKQTPPPPPPPLTPPRFTRTHAHTETTLKGNGSVFFFFFSSQVLPKFRLGFKKKKKKETKQTPRIASLNADLESKRKRLTDCRRWFQDCFSLLFVCVDERFGWKRRDKVTCVCTA